MRAGWLGSESPPPSPQTPSPEKMKGGGGRDEGRLVSSNDSPLSPPVAHLFKDF